VLIWNRKYYSRSAEFVHLDAEAIHRKVDYLTDGLNVALTELAKVVLIEDNKRSLKVNTEAPSALRSG